MEYKATVSFAGPDISMHCNEIRELAADKAAGFIACGYLVPVKKQEKPAAKKKNK